MDSTIEKLSMQVSASIGKVSVLLSVPEKQKAVIVLAHGAGAGMAHAFMEGLAAELIRESILVVRYNFPYMENKKRIPDQPAIAEKTVSVVINEAHKLYPNVPLYVAGKSFGGRMTSQLLSKDTPAFVKGIIFYGFPLHPAGKPAIDRAAHLKRVSIPMLFIQGTKDALAELSLIEKICSEIPLATLIKFEGADHSFKARRENLIPELAAATVHWMNL